MNRLLRRSVQAQLTTLSRITAALGVEADEWTIPGEMSFIAWVEELARNGLKVDGRPFSLDDRPALRPIYEAIPSSPAAAFKQSIAVMKGAQTGLTVMTFLVQLFFALKFAPVKVGAYYPDRSLAAYVSDSRFLPVVRTVPAAHAALLAASDGGEGNVMNRKLGSSEVLFLWTSGAAFTESFPLDMIVTDEVQGMTTDDIERIRERMSASAIRFFLGCSTAKWPGADIDFLYRKGDQRRFHSDCACPDGVLLDEHFPETIAFNGGEWPGAPRDYIYICPTCRSWVQHPQQGRWVAHNPGAPTVSFHFPQTLSPTVSAREVIESFESATDLQNFYNRKLGVPWVDPNQVPITLTHLEACAHAGKAMGLAWKAKARGAYMGLDQMGQYIVAIVKERLPDGRQAVIHVEAIYADDPWQRCDALMEAYGVAVCAVEANPNFNEAHRFAKRHKGRVFVINYGRLENDTIAWGDAPLNRSERRTAEEVREQHTAVINQFKCMSISAGHVTKRTCLFPDPNGLEQDIRTPKGTKRVAILREEVWLHLTKFALVAEQDPEQRKWVRKVLKIGLDPHFAFANMLCDVAWARDFGTGQIIIQAAPPAAAGGDPAAAMPGLPAQVAQMIAAPPAAAGTCGACRSFEAGACTARRFRVQPADPACLMFAGKNP